MLSEKQKQIQNTIIYTLPVVITSIMPLVTLPIFTRILTPNDYGNLGLAMVYAIVAGGLFSGSYYTIEGKGKIHKECYKN